MGPHLNWADSVFIAYMHKNKPKVKVRCFKLVVMSHVVIQCSVPSKLIAKDRLIQVCSGNSVLSFYSACCGVTHMNLV